MNLLRKTKKDYFNDLNIKNITDNKAFWKTIKPYFSNKGLNSSSLILSEKNEIVTNEQDIANIMNNYFTGITGHLNLKVSEYPFKENKNTLKIILYTHLVFLYTQKCYYIHIFIISP